MTATDAKKDRTKAPTGRLMLGMVAYAPWRYAANVILWTTMWLLPVIPGLLTAAFFNQLEAEPGFNPTTLIAAFFAYGLARLVVMVVGMLNDVHFGFRTSTLLRRNMLERLYERPGADAVHESPGDMITRYREDVDHVEEALSWTVDMAGTAALATVAAVILLSIDPVLTILVFAPLVIVVATAERMSGRIRRYRVAARDATGQITGMLGETFGSVQSIRVAGAEQSTLAHFRRLNDQRRKDMVRDRVLTATLESVFWNTVNIGIGLILILGASSLSDGSLGIGDFTLFVYFLDFVTDAGYFVGLFLAKFKQSGVAFDRMAAMLGGADPMILVEKRDLDLTGELPEVEPEQVTAGDLLDVVAVDGLTFHHRETGGGVDDAGFTLPRGSFTVVTGKVGAGKTTLLRAMLGLLPAQGGTITWNGEPVTEPGRLLRPAPVGVRAPGPPAVLVVAAGQPPARSRRRRRGAPRSGAGRRVRGGPRRHAGRARHDGGSARGPALGRAGAAHGHRPHVRPQVRAAGDRRPVECPRRRDGANALAAPVHRARRGHRPGGVAPQAGAAARRHHPGDGRGPDRRQGPLRRAGADQPDLPRSHPRGRARGGGAGRGLRRLLPEPVGHVGELVQVGLVGPDVGAVLEQREVGAEIGVEHQPEVVRR